MGMAILSWSPLSCRKAELGNGRSGEPHRAIWSDRLRRAFLVGERAVIVRILQHLDESTEPPRAGLIRDPPAAAPAWAAGTDDSDAFALEPDTQNTPQTALGPGAR